MVAKFSVGKGHEALGCFKEGRQSGRLSAKWEGERTLAECRGGHRLWQGAVPGVWRPWTVLSSSIISISQAHVGTCSTWLEATDW